MGVHTHTRDKHSKSGESSTDDYFEEPTIVESNLPTPFYG